MCSSKDLKDYRRTLEAAGICLFGGSMDESKTGACVNVGKFLELYLRRLYAKLDKDKDIENGHVKMKVMIDVTNDGTRYASCSINIAGLKIFPFDCDDLDLQHDKVLCIPLSVFVSSDNTTNLANYHGHLYHWFQVNIPNDGKIELKLENGESVGRRINNDAA
jgi:hypothetical protein